MEVNIQILPAFQPLVMPAPFKIYKGGRGGAKSWQFADALIAKSFTPEERILCTREFQTSIKDSVHKLLTDRIYKLGVAPYFEITEKAIRNRLRNSEFIFTGLHNNEKEIKSKEGCSVAWCEEGENISTKSWETLLPTIRRPGAEIWVGYNPETENNATDKLWVKNPPPGTILRHVTWRDNPYFPEMLNLQRLHCLATDPQLYDHIWEGGYRQISESVVFKNRVTIEDFETPANVRFFYGVDWGFSQDPTVIIRFFITGEGDDQELWIDYESYGYETPNDELAPLFDTVPGTRKWPMKADCARPETINHMQRRGFNIEPAKKWSGSVEDGIAYLKGFKIIHVHARCPKIAQEFRLYKYKIDKTGTILPILVDAWNHGIDAVRYGLDGFITNSGASIFDSI